MKKIITILSCIIALFSFASCDWFVLDNMDGWDAQVEGQIIDAGTGKPLQMEHGSSLTVYEKYGVQYDRTWDEGSGLSWLVKNNGTYVNKLTFAGKYEMDTRTNNFQAEVQSFELKKGANTVNFNVNPFCRILDPQITLDGKKIKATFKVEAGVAGVNNVGAAYLCIYPDRFVKQSANKASSDPGAVIYNIDPTKGETITLTIDPDMVVNNVKVNADEFQYERPHYIRIAAVAGSYAGMPEWTEIQQQLDWTSFIADGMPWANYADYMVDVEIVHPASFTLDGNINGSGAYNYSPVFKLENGQFTEVTDW